MKTLLRRLKTKLTSRKKKQQEELAKELEQRYERLRVQHQGRLWNSVRHSPGTQDL
jgi:hypothetical protein